MPSFDLNNAPSNQTPDNSFTPAGEANPVTEELTRAKRTALTFDQNNEVASYFNYQPKMTGEVDPSYDWKTDISKTPYADFADKFALIHNQEDSNRLKAQIEAESETRRLLSLDGGTGGGLVGGVAAGVLSPTILIPGLGLVKSAKTGLSIAKTAAATAGLSTAAVGIQEAAIQQTQVLRTPEESYNNMAAAAILGAALGGASAKFINVKNATATIKSVLDGDVTGTKFQDAPPKNVMPDSAGAASVLNKNPEGTKMESLAPDWMQKKYPQQAATYDKVAYNLTNLPGLESPVMKGIRNEFSTVREMTSDLFDVPVQLKMHANRASDLSWENKMWVGESDLAKWSNDLDKAHTKYNQELKASGQPNKSFEDFNTELARAFNRPDVTHESSAVHGIVDQYRKTLKMHTEELVKVGKLTEEQAKLIETGDLSRVWLKKNIIRDRVNFRDKLATWIVNNSHGKEDTSGSKLDFNEATAMANDAIDKILANKSETVGLEQITQVIADKGVRWTKERTLNIPNSNVEDYISSDFAQISTQFMRQAQSLKNYYEFLNKWGADNPNDIFKRIDFEYDHAVVEAGNDVKRIQKLGEELQKGKKDIKDSINIMLGQYTTRSDAPIVDRGLRLLQKYNYMRMMGGVVASSVSDVLMRPFRRGLGQAVKDWGTAIKLVMDKDLRGMASEDLKALNVLQDIKMNGIYEGILNGRYEGDISSGVEKVADKLTEVENHLNLINYWTGGNRAIVAIGEGHTLINNVMKGFDSLSEADKIYYRQHFLDAEHFAAIKKQFEKVGVNKDGLNLLNLDHWDNVELKDRVVAAIQKSLYETVLRPSKGDIPKFAQSSQAMKTVFQFKSFTFASSNRILLPALQRRDLRTVAGMTGLIQGGIASYIIKSYMVGQEPDMSPDRLLLEGVNRSGMMGFIQDPVFGLLLKDFVVPSRYAQQSKLEYLVGVSGSVINSLSELWGSMVGYIKDGKLPDRKTANEALKLLPFQNVVPIDMLLHELGFRGK